MSVWVDTDMSVDDVFALLLLEAAGETIDGVSLSFGVAPLRQVRRNAASALSVFGWRFPLYVGSDRAILGGREHATRILGETGIRSRGLTLPPSPDPAHDEGVIELAIWLEAEPRRTILALGPLTNIAAMTLIRPELVERIERIVWMGGGVTSGNHTASAEFNALADPEALAILIARGVPIRMIDLDQHMPGRARLDRRSGAGHMAQDETERVVGDYLKPLDAVAQPFLRQAEQAKVVLGVREFRVIQHIVLLVSMTNLGPQLVDFLDDAFGRHLSLRGGASLAAYRSRASM